MGQQLGQTGLFCRFNPPQIVLLPTGQGQLAMQSLHPAVDKNETCGQFEPEGKLS